MSVGSTSTELLRKRAAEATARYRAKNTDKVRQARRDRKEIERAWVHRRLENPKTWGKMVISRLRHRAKRRGLLFNLTTQDLVPPSVCPVFGTPFDFTRHGNPGATPNAPSVDRIDNSRGYTADNIEIICNRANLLKKDATLHELQCLVAYMEKRQ